MDKPIRGEYFIISAQASQDKLRYGVRVCKFDKREYLGCSLHGELMGYAYCFKLFPDDIFASVRVIVPCDEKTPEDEILKRLFSKISRYGTSPDQYTRDRDNA